MGIDIYVNGKREEFGNDISISRLLEFKKIRPEVVAVELNGKIIERQSYQTTLLKPDDRLEFVYYMGGGDFSYKL